MNFPLTLIDLAGSVALLLWGVRMVQTGVQRAFGAELRRLLGLALRNRFTALSAGIGVTAALQSSTATGLMVTGFAAMGLVDLVQGLAVMLGANIGTTLIVQILSFDIAQVSPALILLGFLVFQRATAGYRDFGRVLIGLGLLLLALHQMVSLLEPYEDEPSIRLMLGAVSTQPVLDIILGAGLAWAAHSSVAIVLVVMSFVTQGAVPPYAAFALILGANLGTALNPILEGASGDDPAAKRLPVGNLINRLVGIALIIPFLPALASMVVTLEPNEARAVADFHTAFNVGTAVLFFPLLSPFAALLTRLLPARVNPVDPSRPMYLDQSALEAPVVAIGAAAREALRMTDVLENMLQGFRDALDKPQRRQINQSQSLDDILDKLNGAIKAYLLALDPEALSDNDHRRVMEILTFATNVEQAGDIIDRNLLALASKGLKRGVTFSKEGKEELLALTDRLLANARQAGSLFMTEDLRAARMLANEKETFRESEARATTSHFARLRAGGSETVETTALHLDLLRDLKSVNSHLIAASAYPVLERNSELLPSRLRSDT